MKKIFTFLTTIILICGVCLVPTSAAGNGKIALSSANGKQGDNVTLNVTMSNNPGLVTMSIRVEYDTNILQLIRVADTKLLVGSQLNTNYGSPYKITWADGSATTNNKKTGAIANFTFKIKDNAKVGSTDVKLYFIDSYDTDYTENNFSATSGKIDVGCKSHTFGNYTNVNASTHKRVCSACGFEETKNHTWNGGTVTKQATCKESGTKHFTCTACGAAKDETIAKTNSHSWGGYKVTKNPACTTPGTQTRTCSVCGKTETQQINATGHSMGAWTQSKAPTCTAAGEEKRSCSKCGHSETRALKALGHSFSHPTVTKEPTCTESGTETGKCSRCGQETSNSIKATGHKFGAWENVKEATCKEGGTQKRVCSKCKAEETKATEALGHDFENPTIVKAATISETGLKEGKCRRCGETTSEVIPCSAQDEATGTLFEANEGVFAVGTQLTVEEIKTDNPTYASAKNILKDVCGEFKLYNIVAVLNGAEAAPNGEVKTTFNIPDGFGKDIALYAIKADGTSKKIDCEISEDGKTLTAKLSALGDYAICKLGESEKADNNTAEDGIALEKPEKSNTALYIIIAACAVVLIGGGIAFMVIKKKRIR